jgi:hypothetical protein
MKPEEIRDQKLLLVNRITEMLMSHGFTFEYVVRKKPKGIRIVYEVTQEEMSAMVEKSKEEKV